MHPHTCTGVGRFKVEDGCLSLSLVTFLNQGLSKNQELADSLEFMFPACSRNHLLLHPRYWD